MNGKWMLRNLNREETLLSELLKRCIFLMVCQIFKERRHYGLHWWKTVLTKKKEDCEYLETWEHFSRMALPKNYSNTNHVWNKDLTFLLSAYVHMILKISVIILHYSK